MSKFKALISGLKFPESPFFDSQGNLWFVEIKGGNLSRWDGHHLERFHIDGTPNGAAMDAGGLIWYCDSQHGEIRTFDIQTRKVESVCTRTTDGNRLKRPNDLIFDQHGNLLFSDHADARESAAATICVLNRGVGEAKIISSGKFFTNGLAFRSNGQTLLFAETYNQQLWIAEWDANNLELLNERPFAKAGTGPQGPDGIEFDAMGNLYVAIYNEGKINIYSEAGELTGSVRCSGMCPTSCTFDPSGKLGLVVTEAEFGRIIYQKR